MQNRIAVWAIIFGALPALLLWSGCGKEAKSRIGESCTRTADCHDGARCVANTCVREGAAPARTQPARPKPTARRPPAPSRPAAPSRVTPKPPARPAPAAGCPAAKKLVGFWGWSTTVVGATNPRSIGANGYYQMNVSAKGCTLTVKIEKTGYGRKTFSHDKTDRGTASFEAKSLAGFDGMATGRITLADKAGHRLEMSLTFIADGGKLWGYWSYEGAKWRQSGFWGALKGQRNNTDRHRFKRWADQPCVVQCSLGCEAPRRAKEGTPMAEYRPCVKTCAKQPRGIPSLCRPRGSSLAPEDVKFRDRKRGLGWSNRCYKHYKAGHLAFAEAACRKGIKVAHRATEGTYGEDAKATKALGQLFYNMAKIYERRGLDRQVLKYALQAMWWKNGDWSYGDRWLKRLGWKDKKCGEGMRKNDMPCRPFPRCCFAR